MNEENLEVEEKQTKQFDPVVGQYFFEVEVAGLKSERSPTLEALKPGIDLHFYRYGLFPESAKSSDEEYPVLSFNKDGEQVKHPEEVKPGGAPSVDGFFYGRTVLNPGYLYVFDANNENLWYEYEVDGFGRYIPVLWAQNKENGKYKDAREANGNALDYLTFKTDTELWVAYSPVQWSIDYHQSIRSDAEKRQNRMLKIKCTGFKKDEASSNSDILPFDEVETIYWNEESHFPLWFNKKIDSCRANFERDLKKESDPVKEDMHITLYDSVGCALDINQELGFKNIEFRALVENIKTGQPVDYIKKKLMNEEMDIPLISDEHYHLFLLALTCYQMVYSTRENTEKYDGGKPGVNFYDTHYPHHLEAQNRADAKRRKLKRKNRSYSSGYSNGYQNLGRAIQETQYSAPNRVGQEIFIGYGLDRQKVEGILGIEDRQKLRNQIEKCRDKLGDFLKSAYFKGVLDDYLHNTEVGKLDGMAGFSVILSNLFVAPADVERHLLLPQHRKKDDQWKQWICALGDDKTKSQEVINTGIKSKSPRYQSKDPLHALMSSDIELQTTSQEQRGIAVKMAAFMKAQLNFMSEQAIELKEFDGKPVVRATDVKKFVVKKLQTKYKYKGSPIILLRRSEIYAQLNAFGYDLDKTYVKIAPYNGRKDWLRIYQNSENVTVSIEDGRKMIEFPVEYDRELSNTELNLNKLNHKAAKILNSGSFNGFMAGVQMLNMYSTVSELESNRFWKSFLSTGGAAADLTEAVINVQKAQMAASGIQGGIVDVLRQRAKVFGAIGGFATAGICIWDAVDAFSQGDVDAGVAWIGAGVSYGVATVMTTFCSGMAMAGPVGLIAAAAGFGLFVLANELTDDELEEYFKNFLLGDRIAFAKDTAESPAQYNLRILSNRRRLMGSNPDEEYLETLMNPYDALAWLYDLIVCPVMTFKVKNYEALSSYYNTPYASGSINSYVFKSFKITMEFNRFFNEYSSIESHAYLFIDGFKRGESEELKEGRNYAIYVYPDNRKQLMVDLYIPYEYLGELKTQSDLLFAVRIDNSLSQRPSFPFILNEEKRYLGAIADLGSLMSPTKFKQVEEVQIDTLNHLLNPKRW
ncbi:hypothetical protein BY457_12162 [Marinilabilia salmonicolor]|jgi:hypothetical protein|uniref:toxin VasX n=1 Tax=Marinilabilia salmonicolor TaxID=989 RepID=UPI000D04D9E0|nr:toxin VasX [Marinilabilia salmonicolor]PRY93869.1 hypothetical protein BY457_12162 [Marinilabilia salmonicolor]